MEIRIELTDNVCYLETDSDTEIKMLKRILRQEGGWFMARTNSTEYALYPCHRVTRISPIKFEDTEKFKMLCKGLWIGIE